MNMTQEELDRRIEAHGKWFENSKTGEPLILFDRALPNLNFRHANLKEARFIRCDLSDADFRFADLERARFEVCDLRDACLVSANLIFTDFSGSYLSRADFGNAKVHGAELSDTTCHGTDFSYCGLCYANLERADLRGAGLDFASWPLWCGSLEVKIDARLAAQLLYHAMRAMQSCADDPDVAAVFESKACVRLANRFHLVEECGPIEPTKQPNKEGDEK